MWKWSFYYRSELHITNAPLRGATAVAILLRTNLIQKGYFLNKQAAIQEGGLQSVSKPAGFGNEKVPTLVHEVGWLS